MKMIMLTLIVVIVGLVILIKSSTSDESLAAETPHPPRVALNEVLPPSPAPRAQPALPAPAPKPTPAAVEPTPDPESEPEPVEDARQEVQDDAPEQVAGATAPQAKKLIEEALELRDKGDVITARDRLNEALAMALSPQIRTGVMDQMAKLSETWLFGRHVLQGDKMTGHYLVQPGDLLSTIGRNHKVPYELLMRINGIERAELLRAGQRIKVVHGPFNAVVNRTTMTMDLYLQDIYVKSYKVGLGRPEHTTPTGRWIVARGGKLIKPTWTDPDTGRTYKGTDPDYPLGSRWIALDGIEGDAKGRTGFALHGTHEPKTIGTLASRGCIRLHNGDIIEVYNVMAPEHSYVIVMD